MIQSLYIIVLFCYACLSTTFLTAQNDSNSSEVLYQFTNEPIDVVIPSIRKDLATLNLCIAGIKKNCLNVRRVIVVSAEKLTDEAEWFNEADYPFTKKEIAYYLCHKDKKQAKQFLDEMPNWVGWYYQQLLKLYAPFVIPGISSNVLIVDSDSIFLNPVEFLNEENAGMYHPGEECIESYYVHARKLLPSFNRPFPHLSGITHHMLFQKSVLKHLFSTVKIYHNKPFWKAFCLCADNTNLCTQGASEYELYFNFLFNNSSHPTLRSLKHINSFSDIPSNERLKELQDEGYHYGSFHVVTRERQD